MQFDEDLFREGLAAYTAKPIREITAPSEEYRKWIERQKLPTELAQFLLANALRYATPFQETMREVTKTGYLAWEDVWPCYLWPQEDVVSLNDQESELLEDGFIAVGSSTTGDFMVVDFGEGSGAAGWISHDKVWDSGEKPRLAFLRLADSIGKMVNALAYDPAFPNDYWKGVERRDGKVDVANLDDDDDEEDDDDEGDAEEERELDDAQEAAPDEAWPADARFDLRKLPRWAIVSFSIQCLRLVKPLYEAKWETAPESIREAAEELCVHIERAASEGRPLRGSECGHFAKWIANHLSYVDEIRMNGLRAGAKFSEIPPSPEAIFKAVLECAETTQPHPAIEVAKKAHRCWQIAAGYDYCGAMEHTFERLFRQYLHRAASEHWGDSTPVHPAPFEPDWREELNPGSLTRMALTALSSRVARRVQPAFVAAWPTTTQKWIQAVDAAIAFVEGIYCNPPTGDKWAFRDAMMVGAEASLASEKAERATRDSRLCPACPSAWTAKYVAATAVKVVATAEAGLRDHSRIAVELSTIGVCDAALLAIEEADRLADENAWPGSANPLPGRAAFVLAVKKDAERLAAWIRRTEANDDTAVPMQAFDDV